MSLLRVVDGPSPWPAALFGAGVSLAKVAADAEVAYNLAGRLYASASGWLLMSVPNAFVRGVFAAMAEPGVELPPAGPSGNLDAHVSVMRPEELEMIGGPDRVTERGKQFRYTLGRVYSVTPDAWPGVERVWFCRVHSPELQALRRSYGLSGLPKNDEYAFHVTIAVRRRGVLGRGGAAKV